MGKLCDPVETYAAPTHVYSRAEFDRSALNRKGIYVRSQKLCERWGTALPWNGGVADLHRNSPLDP